MRSFTLPLSKKKNCKKVAWLIHCTCIPTRPICIHLIHKAHSPKRNLNFICLLFLPNYSNIFQMHKSNAWVKTNWVKIWALLLKCLTSVTSKLFCHMKCVVYLGVFFHSLATRGCQFKKSMEHIDGNKVLFYILPLGREGVKKSLKLHSSLKYAP